MQNIDIHCDCSISVSPLKIQGYHDATLTSARLVIVTALSDSVKTLLCTWESLFVLQTKATANAAPVAAHIQCCKATRDMSHVNNHQQAWLMLPCAFTASLRSYKPRLTYCNTLHLYSTMFLKPIQKMWLHCTSNPVNATLPKAKCD